MSQVFVHEIEKLKKRILTLSAQVEENVVLAVKALITRDEELARQIVAGDVDIDRQEVEVEEEALKILALYQPVAMDLRFGSKQVKQPTLRAKANEHAEEHAKEQWRSPFSLGRIGCIASVVACRAHLSTHWLSAGQWGKDSLGGPPASFNLRPLRH